MVEAPRQGIRHREERAIWWQSQLHLNASHGFWSPSSKHQVLQTRRTHIHTKVLNSLLRLSYGALRAATGRQVSSLRYVAVGVYSGRSLDEEDAHNTAIGFTGMMHLPVSTWLTSVQYIYLDDASTSLPTNLESQSYTVMKTSSHWLLWWLLECVSWGGMEKFEIFVNERWLDVLFVCEMIEFVCMSNVCVVENYQSLI